MNIKLIAVGSRPWELLLGHWGISLLIDDHIFFDTFANYRALSKKMQQADITLADIHSVVISHDHWDHIGGLWKLLKQRGEVDVYLPSSTKDKTKQRIRSAGGKIINIAGTTALRPNIYLSNEITSHFKDKTISEQSLIIKSPKGLIVIVGCSHAGIVEIVHSAEKTFNAPVYGLVGGASFNACNIERSSHLRNYT